MPYTLKKPYDKSKPGDVAQLECLRRAVRKKRFGVFFQQRVGKTRVAIDFAGHKIAEGAKRVLILCPLCAQGTWKAQLREYLGSTGYKVQMGVVLESAPNLPKVDNPTVIICTYDKAVRYPKSFYDWRPEVVILDEAHVVKNRTSKRSKIAYNITRNADSVLGLTGTPYSNKKYSDLFGLFRAINPVLFGTRWADFQERYCEMGGYMGYEVVGFKNTEIMLRLVDENSMRVLRRDIMKEPEAESIPVVVMMPDKERKYYQQMLKDCVIFLEEQPRVTADMVTTQRTKLQQITSGRVKDDEGNIIEVGNSKLEYTRDLVDTIHEENANAKIVIVGRYISDIQRLKETFTTPFYIDGGVPGHVRDAIIKDWSTDKKKHVIVVQEQTVAMAVDMSIASDMIFYSWGEDSVIHSQVKDRLLGRNQKADAVRYHYMTCEKTIDGTLYKALTENISFADQAANWRRWIGGE